MAKMRTEGMPPFNEESAQKQDVEQEPEKDYSQHEEAITVDDMLNFDRDHDESTLLGLRWLCKGSQAAIQGPTGVGKSSLIMQASIRWILGRSFFGVKPVKPMKILVIQAENDMGDMSEAFQDMTNAMSNKEIARDQVLTNDDLDTLRGRMVIRRVDSLSGDKFVAYLAKHDKPDSPANRRVAVLGPSH
jgi:predicted ATP-dependent serine protease